MGKVLAMVPVVLVAALFVIVQNTFALDEDSAKESECFEIKKSIPFTEDWEKGAHIYYPLMSRLDLYRAAKELTGREWKDIGESELYYESCIHFESNDNGTCVTKGFNGLRSEFEVKSYDEKTGIMEFGPKEGKEGFSGKCYNTFTDQKTFTFVACCTNDNQMSWGVVSNMRALPEDTVKNIHDHALSLGFKKEYFTSLRYETCGDLDAPVNEEVGTTVLPETTTTK